MHLLYIYLGLQVTELAGIGNYVDIEQNLYQGRVKAITAYYGSLVEPPTQIDCTESPEN